MDPRQCKPKPFPTTKSAPAPASNHKQKQETPANQAFLPLKTSVGVNHWAAYQSPTNFARPNEFIPERWLPSPSSEFASDRKSVLQPFSTGPRNCIGRNLAYMEMHIILARMMWNFDLDLCEGSEGWERQNIFTLWEKGPLTVWLSERV